MGDYHVRFCERLGLKCPGLLDDTHIILIKCVPSLHSFWAVFDEVKG